MRRDRTSAERDAMTVELVYAATTGALLAAVGYVAMAAPVLADGAHDAARKEWLTAAAVVAAVLFCGRVALTLWRFERQFRLRESESAAMGAAPRRSERARGAMSGTGAAGGDAASDQPSQPGRTSPDS